MATIWAVFVVCNTARAEREVIIQNGTLIAKEITQVILAFNVPPGIPADEAYKLFTGEKEKVLTTDKVEQIPSFSFPLIKEKIMHVDRIVMYHNGAWFVSRTTEFNEPHDSYLFSILLLWMPVLLILITSIINLLSGAGAKKLSVFYAAIPISMLIGTLFTESSNIGTSLISMLVGLLAGGLASGLTGFVAGGLTCGFVGEGARTFTIGQNDVVYYLAFLLVAMAASFVIAQVIKRMMPKKISA
ncbi:MAG: hypothetical protein ABSB00_00270 [Minisyncoccia bacterium]